VTGRRLDLFDALAQPLREQIHAGELPPGALLPSESELARAAGTKRYSIRKTLALVREEGLISPIPGRGWVVVDRSAVASGAAGVLPRYRQIAAELRAAIEDGQLQAGSVLPSEADLTARHAVSRATVRQALAVLESDGLITTYPGKGRYVRVQ
jgi:DNA-binding GntR family transcriptional regulator